MKLRTPAAVLASILLTLFLAAPAAAHAELVSSDPEDKAVLDTPPTTVSVTLSEPVDPDRSRFELIGPAGTVGVGRAAGDPEVLVLDGLDLRPGEYEVQWTIASDDGHIERGKLRFTVLPTTPAPATPPPTPVATVSPTASTTPGAAPTATPVAAGEPTPSGEPGDPAAASDGDVLLPMLVALGLVAGVGLAVLRRSRRA